MKQYFRNHLVPVSIMMTLIILAIYPALTFVSVQAQDRDPRNYYPDGCVPSESGWQRAPEAEEYVLTRLNQWRVGVGLYPLSRNTRLDLVASQQATFISPYAPFEDERFHTVGDYSAWHTDVLGQSVRERLRRNGWPVYDNGQVIGAEIAAYFPDVSGALDFWQTSRVHNMTATRPGFREAGVYVMCWKRWLLTYVVLAARPDFVPVSYDPYSNALYLSDESRSFGLPNTGFKPDYIQILDMGGSRLHREEWLVWDDVVQLPANAPDRIQVLFTDGVTRLRTEIDINVNRTFPSQPTPTPIPTITPTPSPTEGPSPTPTLFPTATIVPSATPAARSGDDVYDITLYYNSQFISFVNESGTYLDLEALAVNSPHIPPFNRSMTFFAQPFVDGGGSLEFFPPNTCIQAFSRTRFDGPGVDPPTCLRRVAWRGALEPGERFWLHESFEVTYGLEVIASCPGLRVRNQDATCSFDLPDEARLHERPAG